MAKINGFEFKGITTFKGHDGMLLFQANIYENGKKIGFFSEDAWGGEERIELIERDHEKEKTFREIAFHLIQLHDAQKDYKKALKKGYDTLAVIGDTYLADYDFSEEPRLVDLSYSIMYDKHKEEIEKLADGRKIRYFRNLEDFNIAL